MREYPFFSTQIALMHRGRLIVGVSSAPVYGELAYAQIDRDAAAGAWLATITPHPGQRHRRDRGSRDLRRQSEDAGLERTRWTRYGQLVARANRIRGYGDFLHYHLLAAGKIDVVIESDVNILDIAALAVIVEAAGGQIHRSRGRGSSACKRRRAGDERKLHTGIPHSRERRA